MEDAALEYLFENLWRGLVSQEVITMLKLANKIDKNTNEIVSPFFSA